MQINFFAAARAAAGIAGETVQLTDISADQSPTLAQLIDFLTTRHTGTTAAGMPFAQVLQQCSFLIDGVRSDLDAPLNATSRVDVLPPFAGG